MIIPLIQRNLPGLTRHPIEPETLLTDLRIDDLGRQVIALELGYAVNRDIPDAEALAWDTVGDVMASAGEVVDVR